MKKLFMILLTGLLVLSFAACGVKLKDSGNNNSAANVPLTRDDGNVLTREDTSATNSEESKPMNLDESNAESANPSDDDKLADAVSLEELIQGANRNNLTPEQIASLEADAALNGYELQWQEDGSLVIIDDGQAISLGGNWPDNEFTKQVPIPDFEISMSSDDGSSFTAIFGAITKEQLTNYVEKIKAAGFTEDAEIQDEPVEGMDIYMYTAGNAEGYYIELMYTGYQNAMIISK